jgi:hypothetical protein
MPGAKEKAERAVKMAAQRADRLAAEAKNKDALDQHAKRVAALYKSMREFEAHAEEKAGFELTKAAEKRAALEQALVEARDLCKAAGQSFKAFKKKFAPDYGRTRLYQILAIADGRKTVEEVREEERERKRRQRGVRDNSNVPDEAAEEEAKPEPEMEAPAAKQMTIDFPEHAGGSQPVLMASAQKPIEQVQTEFAALAGEEVPPAGGPAEIDTGKAADDAAPGAATPPDTKPDDGHSVLAVTLKALMNEALVLCEAEHNWDGLRATKEQRDTAVKTLRQLRALLVKIAAPKAVH